MPLRNSKQRTNLRYLLIGVVVGLKANAIGHGAEIRMISHIAATDPIP